MMEQVIDILIIKSEDVHTQTTGCKQQSSDHSTHTLAYLVTTTRAFYPATLSAQTEVECRSKDYCTHDHFTQFYNPALSLL